jgi:hypothetical protein
MISPRSRIVNRRGGVPRNLKAFSVAGLGFRKAVTDSNSVIGEASIGASMKTDLNLPVTPLAAEGAANEGLIHQSFVD